MAKEKTAPTEPQDHLPKKPTKAQAEELQKQLMEHEQERQQEFAQKYNALCDEYGYSIIPQMTLNITKKQ